ncbi:MAG TPA: hypothetical protein VJY39_01725 [Acidisphaera sp.]|nr:hypothetical protein [Acidisphaera sp.]
MLGSGWSDTERDAHTMWRWTDGDALVAIASCTPCRFEVEVAQTMAYAVAGDAQAAPRREVEAWCA